ncbi:MAG: hypothetical protein AB1411_12380 [Nitrospirota bacterium]
MEPFLLYFAFLFPILLLGWVLVCDWIARRQERKGTAAEDRNPQGRG